MLEAEMIASVQRGCRNPRLSSSDISAVLLRGVTVMGIKIKQTDPSYFLVRKSLQSETHAFTKPSDCIRVEKLWDLGTTAKAVSGITAGTFPYVLPITFGGGGLVIMSVTDHGFADGDVIMQHDVGGATEANGTFRISYISADSYALQGTGYSSAWTSGGYAFKIPLWPDEIKRIILPDASQDNDRKWYPRGNEIIVDDRDFTNDVMIDYEKAPSAITDIPAEYHEGLVSFAVLDLIRIPKSDDPTFGDIIESKRFHEGMLNMITAQIGLSLKASSEPQYIRNAWGDSD